MGLYKLSSHCLITQQSCFEPGTAAGEGAVGFRASWPWSWPGPACITSYNTSSRRALSVAATNMSQVLLNYTKTAGRWVRTADAVFP
jgi:hypothetical protein